jgi:isopentenyl-diphosphate delta-isomerase
VINPDEVSSWKWMPLEEVKNDIDQNPDRYTVWFVIIFTKFYKDLKPDLWL